MLNPFIAVIACFRRLLGAREGASAMMFGIMAIPMCVATGLAIDATRAYTVKVRLGAALDAAALAVGSTTNETNTQLTQRMQNYFTANYPPASLGGATATVQATQSTLSAATVDFTASATVPMTLMRLIGINQITVSAGNEIKRTAGMEIALVLDNTGSMLCGPNDGAPNYTTAQCQGSVVAGDTTCTNNGNQSRICVLRNASLNFLSTMENAITASQQLYISVVPYVTSVNVGPLFCTGLMTCSHIAKDACSGDFIDEFGNVITTPVNNLTLTGNLTNGSKVVTGMSPDTSLLNADMTVSGQGIPAGTLISSVDSLTQVTLASAATKTGVNVTLSITYSLTGNTTAGSPIIKNIAPVAALPGLKVGQAFTWSALPSNPVTGLKEAVAIKTIDIANDQVTLCSNAPSTLNAVALTPNDFINYDGANAVTPQWMGCIIEPTSADENTGVAGVQAAGAADPDVNEPSGGWPNWYAAWWPPSVPPTPNGQQINNWGPTTILAQSNTTETQGQVTADWDHFNGPNQGCPVPLLPLTDATTNAGQTALSNTINGMWPRDAGGTQVHIGMIWGWRTISSVGPFTAVNGHPLDYATAANTAWMKAVILMTDGTEEWPDWSQMTGLGYLGDGKIGTTSQAGCYDANGASGCTSPVTNLNTRLQTICSNMAQKGIVIFTIGLGSDGASNTQLQNCPANGGAFYAADTTNLNQVFQSIAQNLLALRLSQ